MGDETTDGNYSLVCNEFFFSMSGFLQDILKVKEPFFSFITNVKSRSLSAAL